jgi:hypothetical protein
MQDDPNEIIASRELARFNENLRRTNRQKLGDQSGRIAQLQEFKNTRHPVGQLVKVDNEYYFKVPRETIEGAGLHVYKLNDPTDPIRIYFAVNDRRIIASKHPDLL